MKIVKTGILVFALSSFFAVHSAFAAPAKGTSAEAAAILKNHPPAGWLSHYLGEDRYKIAGNVWKVVSTQRDKYFHRPNCPEMLRQSANIAIGFPSVASAIEAGYLPDPHCRPAASAIKVTIGGAVSAHATQVRLSDGRSTITLPAGWRKVQSQKINSKYISATIDSFAPGKSLDSGASILTFDMPGGDTEPLSAAKAQQYITMYDRSGYVNSAIPRTQKDVNVRDVTYKGLKGVVITPKSKKDGDAIVYIVKRGSRLYMMAVAGDNGLPKNAKAIIDSYQPR